MDTNTKNEKKLRTGFTTGSCATASSKAGILSIINQKKIEQIDIILPKRSRLDIQINSCEFTINTAKCSVIKDGGDDPDVTHGAEIFVDVKLTDNIGRIEIDGGEGVGGIFREPSSCVVPDQHGPVFGEGDDGGDGAVAVFIGDDDGLAVDDHRDRAVGGSEVDAAYRRRASRHPDGRPSSAGPRSPRGLFAPPGRREEWVVEAL